MPALDAVRYDDGNAPSAARREQNVFRAGALLAECTFHISQHGCCWQRLLIVM